MKLQKTFNILLAVIIAGGIYLTLGNSEASSAGGMMPTVSATGCMQGGQRYVYYAVTSNTPYKLEIGNYYNEDPYFKRTIKAYNTKRIFIANVNEAYKKQKPDVTFSYKLFNVNSEGESATEPIFYGNTMVNKVSCGFLKKYHEVLGYRVLNVKVK